MLSHYHGQIFNSNEMAQSLAISHPTAKHYLEILHQTFMVRILFPWHTNLKKRQVKSPKIYWRDSGIFHSFLNIKTYEDLILHPKLGASFEGFAMEQIISMIDVDQHDCYFWGTHSYGEIDLIIHKNNKLYGFEFKFNDAPSLDKRWIDITKNLNLSHLYIIYPGKSSYHLDKKITAIGLQNKNKFHELI